jgi:hypothetical protein
MSARDFEDTKLTAIYLNTDDWMGLLRITLLDAHKSYFELILSTKCDGEIFHDRVLPSRPFENAEGCTAGQRLYCQDVGAGERLLLAFKVYQSSTRRNTGQFTIEIGIYPPWLASPKCNLTVDTDPSQPLNEFSALMKDDGSTTGGVPAATGHLMIETKDPMNRDKEENPYSDRAIGQLGSGNVVHVAIKANYDAAIATEDGSIRPLGYILHVILLEGSAKKKIEDEFGRGR